MGVRTVRPGALARTAALARAHWPMAIVAAVAACLITVNLGRAYLWEDEGDTAVLARTILDHGVPVAWDGTNLAIPDYGDRLGFGFVMVSHPWLQYYLAAGSFALFGESVWAARLPFALGGLATIVVVYAMVLSLLGNRRAALSAAILLTASVQFLIFSRQARNYSWNALLTCLLVWQFQRIKSPAGGALFALIAILLIHTNLIGLAAVAALALVALVQRPSPPGRVWFWFATLLVGVYAIPWLLVSRSGLTRATNLFDDGGQLASRILQFAVEVASVTPAVGMLALGVVVLVRNRRSVFPGLSSNERSFLFVCSAVILLEGLAMAASHAPDAIWILGLHQAPAIIPLVIMMTALLVVKVSGTSRPIWVALMLLFLCTRVGQVTLWASGAEQTAVRKSDRAVSFHIPPRPRDRILRTTLVHYVRSVMRPTTGVIHDVSEFLANHASAGDVVITNYGWEALYFHTGLPQGAKISRAMPIYHVARAANLPGYLFGADGARWIVWRRVYPAYFAEQDCARLLQQFAAAGWSTRLAWSGPGTLFENRENLHFRRFAGGTYVYPWHDDLPDVLIYRIESFDESISAYRRTLDSDPQNAGALADLAYALARTGKLDEAAPVFERAVVAAPGDAEVRRNAAVAFLQRGDTASAVKHAREAVRHRARDPGLRDLFGEALAVDGRFDEAADQFEEALRLEPAYDRAREHLRRLQALADR